MEGQAIGREEQAPPETPVIEDIKLEANFLKIGDNIFTVKKIGAEGLDMEKEIKEYYKSKFDEHQDNMNESVAQGMSDDWNMQLNHVRQYNSRGTITIPPEKHNKLVLYRSNASRLLEVRLAIYSPTEIQVTRGSIERFCGTAVNRHAMLRDYRDTGEELILQFEPLCQYPMSVGFDGNTLYVLNMRTFHTFDGSNVCCGDHGAPAFWALSNEALSRELSKINTFSLASDYLVTPTPVPSREGDRGQSITLAQFADPTKLIAVRRAREERDSTWSTMQEAQ